MPLKKPWKLPTPRKLTDAEAKVLRSRATALCDIEANGLKTLVEDNIKRNRMASTRLEIYDKDGNDVAGADIHVKLKNHAFKFGCNAFLADDLKSEERNAKYEDTFKTLFNQAVLPNYWKDDEPEKGEYRFEKDSSYIYRRPPVEQMLDFCERTNCQPKGHNLFWPSTEHGTPKWLKFDDQRKLAIEVENRIRTFAEKYADKIPVWDVTNEFIGTRYGNDSVGPDFDVRVWKLANELFYNDELILNDYQCFFNPAYYNGQASALYQQVKKLQAHGIRVDGLGIQCHYFHNEDMLCDDEPAKLDSAHMLDMINMYSSLGTKIHLSEITIASYDGREDYLQMQKTLVENLYKVWFSCEAVNSIVWWNLVDNTAVLPQKQSAFNENYFGGGLFDKDMNEKPALVALKNLVQKEWHTELDLTTSALGFASFSGFCGEYEITIKKGADTYTRTITLDKSHPFTQIILD